MVNDGRYSLVVFMYFRDYQVRRNVCLGTEMEQEDFLDRMVESRPVRWADHDVWSSESNAMPDSQSGYSRRSSHRRFGATQFLPPEFRLLRTILVFQRMVHETFRFLLYSQLNCKWYFKQPLHHSFALHCKIISHGSANLAERWSCRCHWTHVYCRCRRDHIQSCITSGRPKGHASGGRTRQGAVASKAYRAKRTRRKRMSSCLQYPGWMTWLGYYSLKAKLV
jgi:hypothetical protein